MATEPLAIALTEDSSPDHYRLTAPGVNYRLDLRHGPETTLGDLLRRLPDVLVGEPDPAGQLALADLLYQVGSLLWQALLPPDAPAAARDELGKALRTGDTPLRLTLPRSLPDLPWELLADPDKPGGGYLAQRRPLVRLVPGGAAQEPIQPPLRVLLLISSPPGLEEERRVDVESERAAVEEAVRGFRAEGILHLLVEDIVTTRRVQQLLLRFQPHIVHFIGHGRFIPNVGGVLQWEGDNGENAFLPGANVAQLFAGRQLRAILLHACESAESDGHSEFGGVAEALIDAGQPAVFAQQASFTYESSARSSEMFYTALSAGLGLAEATLEVRRALAQSDRPDWAVPTLQATAAGLAPLLDRNATPGDADPNLDPPLLAADLPAPTGPFVGRHAELRALRLMLEAAPGSGQTLALITGPGGIGKSTLAAQAVVRYGRGYKSALTLSCKGYQSFDLFLQRISSFLSQYGVPDFLENVTKLSTQDKIRAAVNLLVQAGPFLIVVDNLETAQNEHGAIGDPNLLFFLQTLLTGLRRGRALITGRYAVAGLLPEHKFQSSLLRLDLDDLSRYEVFQLLQRQPTLARLSRAVQSELIDQFGGLPYVYDLLASDAASQDLAALIKDMQGRVTAEREQRSATQWREVRRQVIEFAALDTTLRRLSESAQRLLLQLAVFRRPFPQTALEQGLGAARADWQPLLDWSLLRYNPEESEYRLHSLTARYAAELIDPELRKATQLRLADWYWQYVNESHALTDALEAHALLLAAGANERAGELANDLGGTLRRFGLIDLCRELCTTTANTTSDAIAAEARRQLGMIAQAQGDYAEARRLYGEVLAVFTSLGNQSGRANTLHQLGIIAQDQGDYVEARRLYGEVLAVFTSLGDQSGRASTLHQLGNVAYLQSDYAEARRLYGESIVIKERLGDQRGRANTLHQLGIIAQAQGDYAEARRLYGEVLAVFTSLGDQRGRASTLHQLGNVAYLQSDYAEARRLYGEVLAVFTSLGNQSGRASTLHQLGIIAQDQGDYAEARRLYGESIVIKERLGDQSGRASTLGQLGIIAQDQGDYAEARRLYGEVLAVFTSLGDQSGRANTLGQLGKLAHQEKDHLGALRYTLQALEIFIRLRSPYQEIARRELARLQAELGEEEFATLWRQAGGGEPIELAAPDPAEDLLRRLIAFIQAKTWGDSQRLVQDQPDLMSEKADALLVQLEAAQDNDGARQTIERHRKLLTRCREIGVDAAFDEFLASLPQHEESETNDAAADQLTKLLETIHNLLRSGTEQQRLDFAAQLDAGRAQLPADGAALAAFLVCLAALLRAETPDASGLAEPYAAAWAALQQAPGDDAPEEEDKVDG